MKFPGGVLQLSNSHKASNSAKYEIVVLGLLLVFGFAKRAMYANNPLWLDELATAWVISDSFQVIFERSWINNLSPLYFIIVYLSKSLFGASEFSLRLPSILAGTLQIYFTYILSKRLFQNNTAAILAAFFVCIDQNLTYFSLEARPYSIGILLFLIQFYIFINALRTHSFDKWTCVTLGTSSGLMMLLHYTLGIAFVCELAITLTYSYRRHLSIGALKTISAASLITIIMSIPVIDHILYLANNKTVLSSWINISTLASISSIIPSLTYYILLPIPLSFILFSGSTHVFRRINTQSLSVVLVWIIIPPLLLWFAGYAKIVNVFSQRYMAWVIPGILILSAYVVCAAKNKYQQYSAIAIILLLQIFTNIKLHNEKTYSPSRWKESVIAMNTLKEDIPVYVKPSLIEAQWLGQDGHNQSLLKDYLLCTVNSLYRLSDNILANTTPINDLKSIPADIQTFATVNFSLNEIKQAMNCTATAVSPKHPNASAYKVTRSLP